MSIESAIDIDWFALDMNDNIIHFASGGGKLPALVINNEINNDLLIGFFHRLPEQTVDVDIPSTLSQFVSLGDNEMENYLRDFKRMAKRGLYSFDKSHLDNFLDNKYHLVCRPKNAISVHELPFDVKSQLLKLRLNFFASELSQVDISEYI